MLYLLFLLLFASIYSTIEMLLIFIIDIESLWKPQINEFNLYSLIKSQKIEKKTEVYI